jgi:DNA polymerase III sliding clamp (beta) subunit (PCNA family)
MLRVDLISKLETVKPAIASHQMVPLLTNFWFTGKKLMAYNQNIGISVPFPTEFKGGVSVKLLELLKVTGGGTEVDVSSDGRGNLIVHRLVKRRGGMVLKPGSGRIRLAMEDQEFDFKMPEAKRVESANGAIDDLMDGVGHCLLSVATDTSTAEYLGVTFEKDPDDERRTVLYSTDSATICRAYIRSTNALQIPNRSIVPSLFCEQMLRLYRSMSSEDREAGRVSFRIASRETREGAPPDRFALFTAGSTVLYGRLVETRNPLSFTNTLGTILPKQFQDLLVPFPDRLRGALERASIVCDPQRHSTKIKVERGRLSLHSESEHEEVKDDLSFKDHDDISVSIEPRLLRRATDFDELLISRSCVILSKHKRGMLYLVSTQ